MVRRQRRSCAGAVIWVLVALFVVLAAAGVSAQSADADTAAAKEVEGLKAALQNAEERISGLRTDYEQANSKAQATHAQLDALSQQSQSSSAAVQEANAKAAAAAAEAAELREGKATAETAARAAQKAQQVAEAARDALQTRVDKAEKLAPALSQAQAELAAARASLSKVEAQLAAAESRADNTQRLADSLLAQHYNEWVPHWVADGYERRVRPAAQSAWETTSDTSRTLYRSSSDKAGQLWEAAGPTAQYYADYTKTVATDVHEKVLKHPHMAALKRRVGEARHALANLKPVKALLAQLARTHAELELLFGRFLRAHPLLAPLGEKGTLKHLVWAVLAAPIFGPLLAALALALSKKRQRKAQPASSSSGRASVGSAGKKNRRITIGGESVSFA